MPAHITEWHLFIYSKVGAGPARGAAGMKRKHQVQLLIEAFSPIMSGMMELLLRADWKDPIRFVAAVPKPVFMLQCWPLHQPQLLKLLAAEVWDIHWPG